MEHLLEVLKILDGAINSDHQKVTAYAVQLATKLEAKGDLRSAEGVLRAIRNGKTANLTAARVAPTLPVDTESRLALADERRYLPENVHVILDEYSTKRVSEFIQHVRAADELMANGVGISPSLLVYGPPGCGKTELAKHIAAQLELPLLTARADALISSYLGSTAKNLRHLFEHAMARPCVLFLDEFDAIAKLRDDHHELGELKRVVVSLLQNIDALDSQTILVAATNHHHLLDQAIWRRFAFHLEIGLPAFAPRRAMLSHFLSGRNSPNIELDLLTHATEGMSGAEIRQLCEEARRNAILLHLDRIDEIDLLTRMARYKISGLENLSLKEKLLETRKICPKLYSLRRLASMFSVSTGKISNLLRSDQDQT